MLCAVARKVPVPVIREMITTPVKSKAVKKYITPANRA
jgi:hypothetical protein